MSLPAAKKDISDKPAPGSVIDPVNKAQKDADVDRKIRFYGVIEAFRKGRMPDNAQIDETLKYVIDNSPVDTEALSPDGKRLIQDARDVIETARVMVAEKNADELLQNFVWHTRTVDYEKAKKDPNEVLPVEKEKARADGQLAIQHLRTLLTLVLTNSEVRKLLTDFSLIGRDLLAKGAAKAAGTIAPSAEEMAKVDDAAPRDQFITKDGRVADPNETPVLEAKIPGMDKSVSQHPKDDVGTGATVTHGDGTTQSGAEAKEQAAAKAGVLKENAKGEAKANAADAKAGAVDAKENGDVQAKKSGFMARVKGFRSNVSERVPEKHKETARGHYDRGKTFLTEEYFPEDRRDQFIYRGKKVIIECQKHKDYQESLKWLLSFFEEYAKHGGTIAGHGKDSHDALTSDPALKTAFTELRTLLERFANGKSMDGIIDALNVLIEDARKDEELRAWFKNVDAYARKVLLDAGFVLEPQCNAQARELRDNGRQFYDVKYKTHFDNLFDNFRAWFQAMGEDPINKRFGEDWARLTRDLLFDSEGSLKFKPELWSDIRKVILPTLIDKIGYIPIPRIEYTDDALDLVVENLTLSGRNLFPNWVSLEAHNYVKFSPYNAIKDEHHHEFILTFSQMQADMRDVAVYFKQKKGFPKIKDSGLADVVLGGSGLTVKVHLASAEKDKTSVFKVKSVSVKVDSLKFSIRDSKHDFLYKTVKPLATGLVKKQIQKAIKDTITTGMQYVDGQLVAVRDRMDEAKQKEGETRTQALQELFQRKKAEGSIRSANRNSSFKVVGNKRNSILANTGHPSGWVNRTTEREDAAAKGTEWRSDAFKIIPGEKPAATNAATKA